MEQTDNDIKLTLKQNNFCNYYLETGNATDSYRRAYSCENMKPETVNRNAKELLDSNKIAARINQLQQSIQKRADITKDEAVKELASMVRSKVVDAVSIKEGKIIIQDIDELSDDMKSAISSIKQTKAGIEVRFYDKVQAIDRLSKMLGWDAPTKSEVEMKSTNIINLGEGVKD